MKYRATQKLLDAISKSNFLPDAPTSTTRYIPYYECLVGIGKDFTMKIYIDEEAVKSNPDYFELIKE